MWFPRHVLSIGANSEKVFNCGQKWAHSSFSTFMPEQNPLIFLIAIGNLKIFNSVLHLKGLTPNGMLPIGILDGQVSLEGKEGEIKIKPPNRVHTFEDAKNLDRVNEKMPTRRKEADAARNSILNADRSKESSSPVAQAGQNNTPKDTSSNGAKSEVITSPKPSANTASK